MSEADLINVSRATTPEGSIHWESDDLREIKRRIKSLHIELQNEACCYCRRSLRGEFAMVIDIEHVIPKAAYPWAILEPVNLSVSCKRCNMMIKKSRVDFLESIEDIEVRAGIHRSAFYRFIHPNIDQYSGHLQRVEARVDERRFVKYLVGHATDKGRETYEFFNLESLEVDMLDEMQGAPAISSDERAEVIRKQLGL